MRILGTLVVAVLLIGAAFLAFVYSGAYNVAATDAHASVVHWTLDTVKENSISGRADGVRVPSFDQAMVREGAGHYKEMCEMCHGAPGVVNLAKD